MSAIKSDSNWKEMNGTRSRTCHACNKTFSKAEHLTRHLRSHTKERPYSCTICGKVYSRSDVLRRHEKSHRNDTPQPRESVPVTLYSPAMGDSIVSTSLPQGSQKPLNSTLDKSKVISSPEFQSSSGSQSQSSHQPVLGMSLHDAMFQTDSSTWFLGADLDVDALDLSLSSAISEWAQLPPVPSDTGDLLGGSMPASSNTLDSETPRPPIDIVKQRWFTCLSPPDELKYSRSSHSDRDGSFGQGNLATDETYRASLSQRLQPRTHDEALPSSDQLNLFAKLFFSRFHSLFPIVHAPSFRPSIENSLLFVSICSVGSLFVGSSHAVLQGIRLFERLNKAILASWESFLAHSHSDALSMVQAAILGQTFAMLSGRPRDLVMADVLHGTVIAWAREASKNSSLSLNHPLNMDLSGAEMEEQWKFWVDQEQRRRVEIALNIHDAELASLLHHEPIRKHRFEQYPHLASEALFMAPTASRWAELYRHSLTYSSSPQHSNDLLQNAAGDSRFAAYGVLESINSYVIEARRSKTLDEHTTTSLSDMLIRWWRRYSSHFLGHEEEDPFSLPVLWHSIFMAMYADIDLLEQAIGRNGRPAAVAAQNMVRAWASSLDASKCLAHALLVQRYLERMRVSSEPAIHVPRGLFTAALSWFCFTRVGYQQAINLKAFDAPEIQLLGSETALQEAQGQAFGDSAFADVNHLHRLIDLLNRVGRWAISSTFAFVLCAALEEGKKDSV